MPVDLVVEEIAHSYQGCNWRNGYGKSIEHPQRTQLVASCIDEHRKEHAKRAAMARQAAFPRLQYLDRIGKIVPGVVEEAMTKARTNDGADKTIEKKGIDSLGVDAIVLVIDLHELGADEEAHDEHEGVPAEREKAYVEKDRIGCPCY